MHLKLFLLLMLAVNAGTSAQTPFANFLKTYAETKGVEVEQENINTPSMPDKPLVIYASMKTVTIDDEYPKVLKAFRRNLENLLAKSYTLVSFTKDADNEDINKVYKFIKYSTVELLHYQKEEDQVTLHVFEMVFKNMKEEELKRMPLTININQRSGTQPMKFDFFPVQMGNGANVALPKTDTTIRTGHGPFNEDGPSGLPGRDDEQE
ncbi:MAG TPA: hypothetical protein VGN63_06040 [Flavisolibacter sp.]|jgi:hypothetical protein|nr:hypothetical protein [Flavisolibacter sp.]